MDSLVNQTSARNIYRALERLPEKLSDTFDDAMRRAAAQPEEHASLAVRLYHGFFMLDGLYQLPNSVKPFLLSLRIRDSIDLDAMRWTYR